MNYDRRKEMTKKAWIEEQKKHRVTNGFNTGTRTMKTAKNPTRAERKAKTREEIKNYDQK